MLCTWLWANNLIFLFQFSHLYNEDQSTLPDSVTVELNVRINVKFILVFSSKFPLPEPSILCYPLPQDSTIFDEKFKIAFSVPSSCRGNHSICLAFSTLESPLDCKEIQPVHSEGDQPWDFFGRNDAKAETPVLWPPHAKSWLAGKDSDVGRAGGEGDDRGWDGWMASLTQWTWVCLSELWELVMDREAWRAAFHGVTTSWTRLSDWSDLRNYYLDFKDEKTEA